VANWSPTQRSWHHIYSGSLRTRRQHDAIGYVRALSGHACSEAVADLARSAAFDTETAQAATVATAATSSQHPLSSQRASDILRAVTTRFDAEDNLSVDRAKEDVNISVDDQSNTLTVTSERKEQSDRDEFGWGTRERSWGKSVRSMALPNTADLQNAEVKLRVSHHRRDCVLTCVSYYEILL
jgi:Hsp20/alpha crystallin family